MRYNNDKGQLEFMITETLEQSIKRFKNDMRASIDNDDICTRLENDLNNIVQQSLQDGYAQCLEVVNMTLLTDEQPRN